MTREQNLTAIRKLKKLEKRGRKKQATEARKAIIEANTGLVWSIVNGFTRATSIKGVDRDDLFSAGVIGMYRALELFDPDRGVAFSTYASAWIRQKIYMEARKGVVRTPWSAPRAYTQSLDAKLFEDGMERYDVFDPDNGVPTPEDLVAEHEHEENLATLRRSTFRILKSPRTDQVIPMLYDEDMSCVAVAKRLGISKQAVHQKLQKYEKQFTRLAKLRRAI